MKMIRFFDVFLSFAALVFLFPVLATVSLILLFTGEHKIFYYQTRVGQNLSTFKLIKFATMLENSPNLGTGTITVQNDPRILPVGRFLRKTKINELPQLINVLRGDMSLIGPRPLTKQTFSAYTKEVAEIIGSVKPGLSGVGSIVFRDEENFLKNAEDPLKMYFTQIAPLKGKLESWFVERISITLYFYLILATILVVIRPSTNVLFRKFPELKNFSLGEK